MRDARCGVGRGRNAQITVEYAVMFVVVVAAIIYAGTHIVRPSVNRFFNATGNVIDVATNEVINR